ncbi:MAG: leucine-rich repeat domain-containing protein [Pirellulales bacterium]
MALPAILLAELLAWSLLRGGVWRKLGLGWQFCLLVVASAGLVTLAVSGCRWFVRRRLQFGLRSLLSLVLLVGTSLGLIGMHLQHTEKQRRAALALEGIGARVSYPGEQQPGLLTFVGRQYFQEPTALGYHQGPLREADLVNIESLTGLQFLSLENSRLSDDDLAHFASLNELNSLALVRSRVTGQGLRHLTGTDLRSLYLCWSPIDDEGLRPMEQFSMLSVLNLNHTRITDAGLVRISSLAGLWALYLDGTPITGDGFVHLRRLRHLDEISLERSWLQNSGLAALRDLSALTRLNISNTNIDDEGVEALCGMSRLKTLRLYGTSISEQGIHRLEQALPDCQILH